MSNSILATLNMKDVGLKRVLAIAISEAHERILEKLGASEVLFLEKNQAVSLAERMHNPNMIEYLPFLEGYSIIEWSPAEQFVGKSLHELDLINQYGVMVVAIKEIIPDKLHLIPTGHHVLKGSEILILLGPNESLDHLKAM
jgi:trk system potassium uptake protein TrkA